MKRKNGSGGGKMPPERRRTEIIDILREKAGRVEVKELSSKMGVTEATVRRDLTALAGEKRVIRSHRYAELSGPGHSPCETGSGEQEHAAFIRGFTLGLAKQLEKKTFLFVGYGPILGESVKDLAGKEILTNSLDIGLHGRVRNGVDIIGGHLDRDTKTMHPTEWAPWFAYRTIEAALIEAEGFDENYVYVSRANFLLYKELLKKSRCNILVAARRRYATANAQALPYDDIHEVVTDMPEVRTKANGSQHWQRMQVTVVEPELLRAPAEPPQQRPDHGPGREDDPANEMARASAHKILNGIYPTLEEAGEPESALAEGTIITPDESRWSGPKKK